MIVPCSQLTVLIHDDSNPSQTLGDGLGERHSPPSSMRGAFLFLSTLSFAQYGFAHPGSHNAPQRRRFPLGRRSSSLFISPAAIPDLPTTEAVAALDNSLNTDNIQSDVLVGMRKATELFVFFKINNPATFKSKLSSDIIPLITTTTEIQSVDTQPVTAVNLAFSQTGLHALGVTDDLGDPNFSTGQFADAVTVGDNPSTWNTAFAGTSIHGAFLLASDTVAHINTQLASIQSTLGASITVLYELQGAARPGSESGHEHFGFMDGISQPAVSGFTNPIYPGQTPVDAGLFLLGEASDPNITARPTWTKDGSFLVFRQLQQLVPEFTKFPKGRLYWALAWSAAGRVEPRFSFPQRKTTPVLAADPNRNNNFTFTFPNLPEPGTENHFNQTNCPFSAHIRKVHPRGDLDPSVENPHFIIRSSIPYGGEVTSAETASAKTANDRGLAFVAYQSNIFNGFVFLQSIWINNVGFPFGKVDPTVGVDPIIGTLSGGPKNISGLDPAVFYLNQTDVAHDVVIPQDYVVSRGGEYFFSPSLSGLSHIAAA
ncbi:Dye-decolorizing peroxidase [Mycena indigotica]|uniref:Dye-decolorizing peroxidase n=1 Tax=Mycena indigotica TaxID=2126181 RepID=A0A8H6WEZ8_9AGAR|nr:Dye-decolorizing peroxidase [Mycena indigotica]KAF7315332.1 Dye-decolorizing peroxidase [Mycena indigotica]